MQPYLSSEITEIREEGVVGVYVDMQSKVLAEVASNLSRVDEQLRFLGSENGVAKENWRMRDEKMREPQTMGTALYQDCNQCQIHAG